MSFSPRLRSFTLSLFALAGSAAAQAPVEPAPWLAFQKLPKSKQAEVLAQVAAALPVHPLVTALQTLASEVAHTHPERVKPHAVRQGKRTVEFPHEVLSLPRRCLYLFGVGTIEVRDPAHPERAVVASKSTKDKPNAGVDPVPMHQALRGCVPNADHALAVVLQRLDVDTTADTFAAFLQSWRNGEESFYEALDRTAGTKDSVFFFDSMLGDFRGQFASANGDPSLRSLKGAHDALHAAFLACRQYRGFREAVAWSLVLPPAHALPSRLARYETKVAGAYSLREQVMMVAAAMDWDLAKLITTITTAAPPLPKPLWNSAYDPYPAWSAIFQKLLPTMIERAGSSDAFLQQTRDDWQALATAIATACERLLPTTSEAGHKP